MRQSVQLAKVQFSLVSSKTSSLRSEEEFIARDVSVGRKEHQHSWVDRWNRGTR